MTVSFGPYQSKSFDPRLVLIKVKAVFQSERSTTKFLNVLNSQYKDIEFTVEKATNILNFLDVVEIKKNDTDYDTRQIQDF